jgi:hypothetical protein
MKKILVLGMILSLFAPMALAIEDTPASRKTYSVEEMEAKEQLLKEALQREAEAREAYEKEVQAREANEAAVLKARIEETIIGTENLDIAEYSPSDVVNIYEGKYVIKSGSVVKVSFNEKFRSRKHKKGDTITFINKNPIVTTKGTHLMPAQTQFIAKIVDIKKTKKFNHNAQLVLQFEKIMLNGKEVEVNAKPFYAGYALKEGASKNWAKGTTVTAVAAGAGTLVGAGVGSIAAGAAVGGGLGLVYSLVGPGVNYVAKPGEEISIILIDDLALPRD